MNITLITLNYKDYEGCKNICKQALSIPLINQILIVDNYSNDGSYEKLCQIKNDKIHIIQSGKNGGYSFGYNCGFKWAHQHHADIVFLCNTDVLFNSELIQACIQHLNEHPSCAAVSGRMYNTNHEEQKSYWDFPNYWDDLKYCFYTYRKKKSRPKNVFKTYTANHIDVEALAGSFSCYRLNALIEVGMYDENVFLYNEENILGYRLRKSGYTLARLNNVFYIHAHRRRINRSLNIRYWIKVYSSSFYLHSNYSQISAWKKILLMLCIYYHALEIVLVNLWHTFSDSP